MPDNPDRLTVLDRALAAQKAQDALRQAMAAVAADIKAEQYVPPAEAGKP